MGTDFHPPKHRSSTGEPSPTSFYPWAIASNSPRASEGWGQNNCIMASLHAILHPGPQSPIAESKEELPIFTFLSCVGIQCYDGFVNTSSFSTMSLWSILGPRITMQIHQPQTIRMMIRLMMKNTWSWAATVVWTRPTELSREVFQCWLVFSRFTTMGKSSQLPLEEAVKKPSEIWFHLLL